jgi:hypothetical protein
MGGLGNQMFQAAHALAQGWKHERESVFLPKSWTPMQGRETSHYKQTVFRNLHFVESIDGFTKVHEGPWEFTEVNPVEGDTVFEGYFQSGKNFLGYDERIIDMFGPTGGFVLEMKEKYPQLNLDNTVSIHIRFGDYKQNPHIHPSVSKEYIDKALSMVNEYSHIFLFGDDKNWLTENFGGENVTLIDEEDYADMWIMSLCKNNIISNSTFSWWAAFLNKNPNKKVLVPSIWFGPSGPQNYKDMFQPDWTKIEVDYINGELKPKN